MKNSIAYVFIPSSYNGPCISESGPKVFEYILKKNNYTGDYFPYYLKWNETTENYMKRVLHGVKKIIKKYDKIIIFGGNHLSLLPIYKLTEPIKYNSITFDAHRDYLYNDGMITHGSFLRYINRKKTKRVIIGYRDNINSENKYNFFDEEISSEQVNNNQCDYDFGEIKYIDIDVDVFDKRIFPYTVCAMDNGITIKKIKEIFSNISIKDVKILSFSEYAYVLDNKKAGLKKILNIVDLFINSY